MMTTLNTVFVAVLALAFLTVFVWISALFVRDTLRETDPGSRLAMTAALSLGAVIIVALAGFALTLPGAPFGPDKPPRICPCQHETETP